MAKAAKIEKGWFSKAETAAIFDVGERQIDAKYRGLAPDAVKTINRRVYFHVPEIIRALVAEAERRVTRDGVITDDPMLLASGDSAALERYRLGRAQMVELDLEERRAGLVKQEPLRQAMMAGIRSLRETGDRLTRKFGNDAGDMYNEGIAEFEAAAKRVLPDAPAAQQ